MSNYTKSTDFASKDALASGNSGKIVKGTEIDTEFNNIAIAIATKADTASPTFTGTVTLPTVNATSISSTSVTTGNAAITGGSVTGITDIAIADGGTGASTAANARANLGTVADTASNGIAVRTSSNTLTARSIAAGTGISVSNGDGVSGNPTITNSGVTSVDSQTGAVTLSSLTAFAKSLGESGYQKFPGGLIIQWGKVSVSSGTTSVTFPTSFSTACYNVVLTSYVLNDTGASDRAPVVRAAPTTTGVSISTDATYTPNVYWLAIGS